MILTCPMCKKQLPRVEKECSTCRADLSLLVDLIYHVSHGLERADELARSGQLSEAVWAYLEVLEVDPENGEAKQKVGRVVSAVRHFDRMASRQWMKKMRRQERFRRMLTSHEDREVKGWTNLIWVLLVIAAFTAGWFFGK